MATHGVSVLVAIPGARRPETARSAARAAALELEADDRAVLARAFGGSRPACRARPRQLEDADAILVMGIPRAGKSRVAKEYVARGYIRLNRDERGVSLRELANVLDDRLSSGVRRVVLDNTYLTRAARSHVVEVASRHRVPPRCVWLDTPLAQAQVNLVERLLDRLAALPGRASREPGRFKSIGSVVGIDSHRVKGDLESFENFIESRGAETGALALRDREQLARRSWRPLSPV